MEFVLADLFGSLGGLLTLFIVGFCLAMPVAIMVLMKKLGTMSEEQDRLHAEDLKREAQRAR